MACDAQSVETLLVNTDKYYSLSQRQWLEWLAQLVINAAGITVTAAINLAASNKMAALSDRNLEECRIAVFTAALFDAQSIINEIATQKYPSLDRHDLMCATIAAWCAAAGGSAQTVETLSVGNGYFKFSQRDDTLAIDAVICAAGGGLCTNVTAVALSAGITGMSDRHLKEVICAVIHSAAGPACATPTGLAATWNLDETLSVSWDAVPVGMTSTEVWISFDNVTYVLDDVVAFPGTTSNTGVEVFDPYVKIRFTVGATDCPFTAAIQAAAPCSVPTGLSAAWQLDTTTIVTWNAPPAGITKTEVYSSTDNITFNLVATVAAPGVTTTLGVSVAPPYVKLRFCDVRCCGFTDSILAIAVPTNFVFASNISFANVVAGWDAPPAGVVSTELWTSTDNITYALSQTLAAPTATANESIPAIGSSIYAKARFVNAAGNGAFTLPLRFARTDWETRAATNSSVSILSASKAVQNNLYSALANASILSKMINVGFFENASGNHLLICQTPIIHTAGGNAWTNSNMGDAMVGNDGVLNNGAQGTGADPGVVGTDFPSDTSGGLTVYAFGGTDQGLSFACGYSNNAGTLSAVIEINNTGNTQAGPWNVASRITVASPGAGYYSVNRTGGTTLNLYYAKVASPHASIGSSAVAGGSRDTHGLSFFATNLFEAAIQYFGTTKNRVRLIAAHGGLTAAESLAFYNAIVAAITFLGQSPV